ncbi:MAG: Na+/H+ antiporter NhaA type, partial [uncultured Blastococcus sp.]
GAMDLRHWVNDGLMALFFFVVGLEIKRELVLGELADLKRAAVPGAAALAGLVVPALVYVLVNLGDPAASAWGVVISTDTAFVLGLLALLGRACPPQLRVFLLALAIADDVGALVVIAVVYTEDLALVPLALAVLGFVFILGLRWLGVWRGPVYLVLAAVAWLALYLSGVHPTLLGVAIAMATPAYSARREEVDDAARRTRAYLQSPNSEFARAAQLSISRSVPAGDRQQQLWQPLTRFVIVPLFALANAGVALTGDTLRTAATSPITLGIIAGLVLGKLLGVLLGAGLAVRLRLGELAPGLAGLPLAGGAALAGIGFTISLFIVDLAFADPTSADQARVGVLAASVLAAVLGCALLRFGAHRRAGGAPRADVLLTPVDPVRDHVRGPVDAPLTLVEYGDFECPFCGRATGAVEELRERFGGQLRYVFRHAPLTGVHPHAQLAAEAAEAAAAQGRFWDMYDLLFASQDRLAVTDLLDHAAVLGLDVQRFAADMGSGRLSRRVQRDLDSAERSGVTGVPAFFVDGRRHRGPNDAETLAGALHAAAAGAAQPDAAPQAEVSRTRPTPPRSPLPDLPVDLSETPAGAGDHPRLTDRQLALLEGVGSRRRVGRGELLYQPGDPAYDLHVVLSGAVAVVGPPRSPFPPVVRVHGARRFLGELDLLDDQPVERTAVVVRPGEVLQLTVGALRSVLDGDDELRGVVLRAFLARRAIRLRMSADLRVVGHAESPDTRRLQEYARAHDLTVDVADLSVDVHADEILRQLGLSVVDLPVVVARDGTVLSNPGGAELDGVVAAS